MSRALQCFVLSTSLSLHFYKLLLFQQIIFKINKCIGPHTRSVTLSLALVLRDFALKNRFLYGSDIASGSAPSDFSRFVTV
ncbi:hypothetical protein FF1_010891 [Malus domestica]